MKKLMAAMLAGVLLAAFSPPPLLVQFVNRRKDAASKAPASITTVNFFIKYS